MKMRMAVVLSVVGLLILSGCSTTGNTISKEIVQNTVRPNNMHEATLQIKGMTCEGCALGVEYQLKHVKGVIDANVSYEKGTGHATYDADKVSAETIAQASDVYPAIIIQDRKI